MRRFAILPSLLFLAACHDQPSIVRGDSTSNRAVEAAGANISDDDGRGARHAPVLAPSLGQRMNAAAHAPH